MSVRERDRERERKKERKEREKTMNYPDEIIKFGLFM